MIKVMWFSHADYGIRERVCTSQEASDLISQIESCSLLEFLRVDLV